MKRIRLTKHAQEQAVERGAKEAEIKEAVRKGSREPAKHGREMCRYNFPFNRQWQGKHYPIKQVAPIVSEKAREIVVITVYTFYF
jgi:endonuclease III